MSASALCGAAFAIAAPLRGGGARGLRAPAARGRPRPHAPRRARACAIPPPSVPEALAEDIRAYLAANEDAAAAPSPLAYVTLRACGRTDLVEPIMDAGGYIAVSRALGVPVDGAYAEWKPPVRPEDLESVFIEEEDSGALALGAGRAARLDLAVDVAGVKARPAGGEDEGQRKAEKDLSVRSGPLPYASAPVPSAEDVAAIGRDVVVVVDEVVSPGERLELTASMRAGTLLLVAASAAGYGKASGAVFDATVLDALQSGSAALAAGHVGLAIYAAAILAPSFKRNPSVWGLKVLLSGPAGMASLRQFGPLEPSEDD